ncbi:MAG: hypothetical protein QM753_13135 [Thermomicrobiales bacterium]
MSIQVVDAASWNKILLELDDGRIPQQVFLVDGTAEVHATLLNTLLSSRLSTTHSMSYWLASDNGIISYDHPGDILDARVHLADPVRLIDAFFTGKREASSHFGAIGDACIDGPVVKIVEIPRIVSSRIISIVRKIIWTRNPSETVIVMLHESNISGDIELIEEESEVICAIYVSGGKVGNEVVDILMSKGGGVHDSVARGVISPRIIGDDVWYTYGGSLHCGETQRVFLQAAASQKDRIIGLVAGTVGVESADPTIVRPVYSTRFRDQMAKVFYSGCWLQCNSDITGRYIVAKWFLSAFEELRRYDDIISAQGLLFAVRAKIEEKDGGKIEALARELFDMESSSLQPEALSLLWFQIAQYAVRIRQPSSLELAKYCFAKSRDWLELSEDRASMAYVSRVASIFNGEAFVAMRQGFSDEAESLELRAIGLIQSSDFWLELGHQCAGLRVNMARLQSGLGRPVSRVLENYSLAFGIARDPSRSKTGTCQLLDYFALEYSAKMRAAGDLSSAAEILRVWVEAMRGIDSETAGITFTRYVRALMALAEVYAEMEEFDEALACLSELLSMRSYLSPETLKRIGGNASVLDQKTRGLSGTSFVEKAHLLAAEQRVRFQNDTIVVDHLDGLRCFVDE